MTQTIADEKLKEGVKIWSKDHVNLKVVGLDGSVAPFKIKKHTALNELM